MHAAVKGSRSCGTCGASWRRAPLRRAGDRVPPPALVQRAPRGAPRRGAGSCRRWTETGGRTRIWRRSTRGSRRAAPPTRRGSSRSNDDEEIAMNPTKVETPHTGSTEGLLGTPRPPVRAPRGTARSCQGWHQEAALRMLMNNLDPDVAERPQDLVVYGGRGAPRARGPPSASCARSARSPTTRRPRPVGEAGRDPEDASRSAARASPTRCSCRAGQLGDVPGARGPGAHDAWTDDGGLLDLHRHAGILQGPTRRSPGRAAALGDAARGAGRSRRGSAAWAGRSRSRSR